MIMMMMLAGCQRCSSSPKQKAQWWHQIFRARLGLRGCVSLVLIMIMCICATFKVPRSQIRQIGAKAKLSKSSDVAEPVYLQEGLRIRGKKAWV